MIVLLCNIIFQHELIIRLKVKLKSISIMIICSVLPIDGQRAQLNHQVQTEVHRESSSVYCSLQVQTHNTHNSFFFTCYSYSIIRQTRKCYIEAAECPEETVRINKRAGEKSFTYIITVNASPGQISLSSFASSL